MADRELVLSLSDDDLIELFARRLPELLERRPDLEPLIFKGFLKAFASREEVAIVLTELRALRAEVDQRFEQVDQRFEQVDQRFDQVDQRFDQVDERLDGVERSIDRLGSRWGIRNERLFRQTIAALVEGSFGVSVAQRIIAGEQFDIVVHDHQHILMEIAASVGPTILARMERKRRLYEESTGVEPARVILATADIHSRRAAELRKAGIEVIEPEEYDNFDLTPLR